MSVFEQPVEGDQPPEPDHDVPGVASRQRQCGRCRGVFTVARGVYDEELSDWWVCQPCRSALFLPTITTS